MNENIIILLLITLLFIFLIYQFITLKRLGDNNSSIILNGLKTNLEEDDLVKVALIIWRLKRGLEEVNAINKLPKKIESQITRAIEWLEKKGLTFNDYTRQKSSGLLSVIEVLNQSEEPGDFEPFIVNTVRPEIRFKNKTILKSQVDVRQPMPKKVFQLSIEPNGSGNVIPTRPVEEGLMLSELPKLTRDGYKFLGWKNSISGKIETLPITILSDTKLVAQWEKIETKVNFPVETITINFYEDLQKNSIVTSNGYPKSSQIKEPPQVSKSGFKTIGWKFIKDDKMVIFPYTVTEPESFYWVYEVETPAEKNDVLLKVKNEKDVKNETK
jgi:hypothetical protein